MVSSQCPDHGLFDRLVLGDLDEADEQSVIEHLAQCDSCSTTVESLTAADTFVQTIRAQAAKPKETIEPQLAALLARVQLSVPRSLAAPVAGAQELIDVLVPPRGPGELGWLGGYRVLSVLGAGGMGIVFEAEDSHLQRRVALKVMKPILAASHAARRRFLREAQAMAALRHDHIVTIYQVSEDRGVPFIAMELLHGEPLEARLSRNASHTTLSAEESLQIGREVASALAFAHSQGLIHRDITPGNIWLEAPENQQLSDEEKQGAPPSFRRIRILDFGLVRAVEGESDLTQLGALAGTPPYMSPEQARSEPLDPRSDLFSLGCVLYRCLTGEAPFKGSTTLSTLRAVESHDPQPPRALNPNVSAPLSDLVMRLLAKNPADRPASAPAVAEQLDALAAQSALTVSTNKIRNRIAILVALGLLIGGLAFSAMLLRITNREGETRDIMLQPGERIEIFSEPPVEAPQREIPRVDKEKPFVLTQANGERQESRHFAEALATFSQGGQIEVHGNGPFILPPIRVDGDLTVTAAPGYRPRFKSNESSTYWFDVHGNVTLVGCDFQCPFGGFIRGDGREWVIRNCRLLLTGIEFAGANLSISDSILTYPIAHSGSGRLELVNNLCRANFGDNRSASPIELAKPGHNVLLKHNSFVTYSGLVACRFTPTEADLPTAITAQNNLFCFQEDATPATGQNGQVPEQLHWRGRDNLYATNLVGANISSPFKLSDWNKMLNVEEHGSRQALAGEVRFAWNEVVGTNLRVSAENLAAIVTQIKRRNGEQFKDLGPDWDQVGPGDAYVKALRLDSHLGSAVQIRPPAPDNGPIVLIRNRNQVGSFVTLAQAAAAARNGDEIEIRKDGAVAGCEIGNGSGALSLSAAAGYAPTVEGPTRFSNEISLAGLHFRGSLDAQPGAQLRRCANCSFEGGIYLPLLQDGATEFVNCFVPGDIRTTIIPGAKLIIRNSVFQGIDNNACNVEGKGELQIEGCVLWSPAPASGSGNFRTHPTKCQFTIVARNSLFESGSLTGVLDRPVNALTVAGLANWQATRNVYRHAPQRLLDELKRNGFSDEGSLELDPEFFNPLSWRLRSDHGDDETSFGANVGRVAVTDLPIEDHKQQ